METTGPAAVTLERDVEPACEVKQIVRPLRLLFLLAGLVLGAELVVVLLLRILAPGPQLLELLLHLGVTIGFVLPLLYLMSFRPLLAEVFKFNQARQELQQAHSDLEQRVQERTAELVAANQALLVEVEERKRAEEQIRFQAAQCQQAETSLETERERLYSLLNELPAFVFLRTPDYSTSFANRQFEARFGDPNAGRCYQVIHQRMAPCEPCPTMEVLRSKRPAQWEWEFADGTSYQLYGYPFTDVDGSELVLELGIEITERKRAQAQLERINVELQALSQAERRERLYAEGLVQASVALNSNLDLDRVLDHILEQTQRVIPCRASAVMLLEGERIFLARHLGLDASSVLDDLAHGVPLETFPVLRTICLERRPVLIPDVGRAPEWRTLAGLEWIRSFASVPLIKERRASGLIALVSEQTDFFDPESTTRLEAFATPATLAIHNASLFRELSAGREHLQSLSRRLVEIQESERASIARELHDEAGQALTSLMVGLKLLAHKAGAPQDVSSAAAELTHRVEGVMENLHRLAANLRPASLDHLGLVAALRQHCTSIADSYGLKVQFEAVRLEDRLPAEIETAVYRIVQEALTNVIRHAEATGVDVILERRNGELVALIEDNGCGFDWAMAEQAGRLGLIGMRERAQAMGGTLTIESAPGAGTTVVVEVPCESPHCR